MHPTAAGAIRGTVAAMAMTGVRRVSAGLGLVGATPPEQLVEGGPAPVEENVSPERRAAVTELVHWSVGATGGALFGVLPRRLRRQRGVGPLYGLAIFAGFELFVQPLLDTPDGEHKELRERLAIGVDHVLYGLILAERYPRPD